MSVSLQRLLMITIVNKYWLMLWLDTLSNQYFQFSCTRKKHMKDFDTVRT